MSFWNQNKVEWHPSPTLWGFLPSLATGWHCFLRGFFSRQDQPLVAPGLGGRTVWVSQPLYCFFVLGAKQKHAQTNLPPSSFTHSTKTWRWGKNSSHQISEAVGPNLTRSFAQTWQVSGVRHHQLIPLLMDNTRWLSRLIKYKCFQRGYKDLCGMPLWSYMLMGEVSFQLHWFSSLVLDFQSCTMCSGTQGQMTELSRDAVQSVCGPPMSLIKEWHCLGYCCWGCT